MSELVEDAVYGLRGLPEDLQESAARAGNSCGEELVLSDGSGGRDRCAAPDRTFLSLDEVRNRLNP